MLSELHIENIAVIERSDIRFEYRLSPLGKDEEKAVSQPR